MLLHRFENEVTAKGAAFTFSAAVIIMFFGAVALVASHATAKQIFDYVAYVSPCIAAILAGLTVYYDGYKGVLFAASIMFLSLGVETFVASKDNEAIPVGIISLVAMIAICIAMTVLRLKAVDNALRLWRQGHGDIAFVMVGSFIVLILFYFTTLYSGFFFFENYACLIEKPSCTSVWVWW